MTKEDIVVDGLVATVGAEKNAAVQTLQTIQYCHEQGFATICGLSNISFGLPERSLMNSAFLTMAIQNGLTMAIANPCQKLLMGAAYASDLLLAKEDADTQYLEFAAKNSMELQNSSATQNISGAQTASAMQNLSATQNISGAQTDSVIQKSSVRDRLKNAVLKGKKKEIEAVTREALAQGEDAKQLLDEVLLPAINLVGDYFDKGTYFLPQLIASAEAMKLSIAVLEEKLLVAGNTEHMPTVVFATVEGDIHDIGKNLVVLMLKNYGFRVVDLGKNVPKEVIVDAAIEHDADIIGLSALMTTTMQKMREVVTYAKEKHVRAKIMVGGAVITEEYAREIGADGYSADAADAVRTARRLLSL